MIVTAQEIRRAQAETASFKVLGADEIFQPLEPPNEVIVGCVRCSAIALFAGYASGSKTWMGIDACVSVATGERWLGRFETKRGATAFVDFESGQYESRRRIQAVARARGFDRIDGLGLVSMPGLYLGDPAFLSATGELAKDRKLIVVDSLRAASLIDENDSRIRLGLDQLREIAERTGCAFIVLTHGKKTSGGAEYDEREVLRGSSAIFDAADTVFLSVFKKQDERFEVKQNKARHGRKIDPFVVRLVDERGGVSVRAEDMAPDEHEVNAKQMIVADAVALAECLADVSGTPVRELTPLLRSKLGSCGSNRAMSALHKLGPAAVRLPGPGKIQFVHLDGSRLPPEIVAEIPTAARLAVLAKRPPAAPN